jgi:hypothetical protein
VRRFQFSGKNPLSSKERDFAGQIEELVLEIQFFANDFGSAASLLDYCHELERTQPRSELGGRSFWWKFVAGRDGAMSLYHFLRTLEAIRGSLNLIPSLRGNIDHVLLRKSERFFHNHFPVALKMRTAIAHLGEIGNTIEKRKRNVLAKGDFEGLFFNITQGENIKMNQSFDFYRFMMTFEGEVITYDLNMLSYQRLLAIVQDCFDAFASAGVLTEMGQ